MKQKSKSTFLKQKLARSCVGVTKQNIIKKGEISIVVHQRLPTLDHIYGDYEYKACLSKR